MLIGFRLSVVRPPKQDDEIIWPQIKSDTVLKSQIKSESCIKQKKKEYAIVSKCNDIKAQIFKINPEWRSVDVLHSTILSLIQWILNYKRQ